MAAPSAKNLLFTSEDGMTVNLVIPGELNFSLQCIHKPSFFRLGERKEENGIVCYVWTTCL
jgi:hypothetical protein